MNEMALSNVAEYYNNRHVLVTGASGFMGKVLIEKLLRSCPKIGKIYILMRPKKQDDVSTRLQKLLSAVLFDNIRQHDPDALKKIVAIEGDMLKDGLGLSPSDTEILTEEINVVFNLAATVRFNDPLRLAVQMNLLGTRRVIDLCRNMENLSALIHVSTAYCNCDKREIKEEIYPSVIEYEKILQLTEMLDDDALELITKKLVGAHPNTYTFTKFLSEQLLKEEADTLPILIIRPSIVCSAFQEPIRGWVDNFNGPSGVIVGCGKGLLKLMQVTGYKTADLIPVDIAINLMIVSAWHRSSQKLGSIEVYNCVSGVDKPLNWSYTGKILSTAIPEVYYDDNIILPTLTFCKYKSIINFVAIFKHWIPSYTIDLISTITGKKTGVVDKMTKATSYADSLAFFTSKEWKFHNNNVKKLWSVLPENDKQAFNFSIEHLNWKNYIQDFVYGTKVYLLKETPSTYSKDKIYKLKRNRLILRILILFIVWRLIKIPKFNLRIIIAKLYSLYQ